MRTQRIQARAGLLTGVFASIIAFAAAATTPMPDGPGRSVTVTAGAASADITPDARMIDWVTQKPYEGILDPLGVQVLVVGVGADRVAIITADLVSLRESAVSVIRDAVEKQTGIPRGNVLVNCSHDHSAPATPAYPPFDEFPDPRPAIENSHYAAWKNSLPGLIAKAAAEADAKRTEASIFIGRAFVGEWLFNRRPVGPDGMVKTTLEPKEPVLPDGLRFGPVDPTATVIQFRNPQGATIATLLTLACHAVSVYPYNHGISADWPGFARRALEERIGGVVLFAQGAAGDIVPIRRGVAEAQAMGQLIAARAATAAGVGAKLQPGAIRVSQATVGAPLTREASAAARRSHLGVEVQVLTIGDLALVALPGEPLTAVGAAIQSRSPYPHTIVLGYSNGRGIAYFGMPGDKVKGGYEMGPVGRGEDECGAFIVETASRLLNDHRNPRRSNADIPTPLPGNLAK
jgi:neutral ceramidase